MIIKYIKAERESLDTMFLKISVQGDLKEIAEAVQEAQVCECELKIQKRKKHRSNNANAMYHELLDRLAYALGTSRNELHEIMLQRYGVTKTYKNGGAILFPLEVGRDGSEVAKHTEPVKRSQVNGKDIIWWRVIKGSSEMNTAEFSHLLDGLISECKEAGIRVEQVQE